MRETSALLYSLSLPVGPLAQLVEQETLNLWVHGSSPWRVTNLGEHGLTAFSHRSPGPAASALDASRNRPSECPSLQPNFRTRSAAPQIYSAGHRSHDSPREKRRCAISLLELTTNLPAIAFLVALLALGMRYAVRDRRQPNRIEAQRNSLGTQRLTSEEATKEAAETTTREREAEHPDGLPWLTHLGSMSSYLLAVGGSALLFFGPPALRRHFWPWWVPVFLLLLVPREGTVGRVMMKVVGLVVLAVLAWSAWEFLDRPHPSTATGTASASIAVARCWTTSIAPSTGCFGRSRRQSKGGLL